MRRTVDIFTVSLVSSRPIFLSPDEAERAARFKFDKDRTRWTEARSALRCILAGYLNAEPTSLEFSYGEHGKPAIAGLEFNLSHSGDFAMIAVTENTPVGIDIERIRPDVDIAKLLNRLGEKDLPATATELYSRWTRREASTKAVGGQLFTAPAHNIHAVDLAAPDGYSAAVALVGCVPQARAKGLR